MGVFLYLVASWAKKNNFLSSFSFESIRVTCNRFFFLRRTTLFFIKGILFIC